MTLTKLTQYPQNPSGPANAIGSEYFENDLRRAACLITELRAVDVRLRIEGDRLVYDAPSGVITADLLARLRADRDGLLAILSRASDPLAASLRPKVVHLKRDPFDVRIDRESRWGNPFRIGPDGDRAEVIAKYRAWVVGQADLMAGLPELRGKRLGCWCAPLACHGDVLADLVEALDNPPAAHDESVDHPVSSIRCHGCGGLDLVDDPGGARCQSCGILAWVLTAAGGLARRDFADEGIEDIDPNSVPICRKCGQTCDTMTLADAWCCSRCDPDAETRRRQSSRVIAAVNRSLKRPIKGNQRSG
jgi:hypothetical protein